jgi:glycerate 2-kinase
LNAARKHCSQVQGGQLARLAAPAHIATLILCDVVGSPLDVIASGPTVPDRSSYADVLTMLERYDVLAQIPANIRMHLRRGAAGEVADTPKPRDPLFERVNNVVVGDNESAARAAVAAAGRQGWHSHLLTTFLQGEAREVGKAIAGLAQGVANGASDFHRPACLVLGGETTVTLGGRGKGGRNQELALSAGIALAGQPLTAGADVLILSLGTDGTDGPTDAAGGAGRPDTVARGRALGLDPFAALAANDSYPYLAALGDLVITGPTNTNVNDLVFAFVS